MTWVVFQLLSFPHLPKGKGACRTACSNRNHSTSDQEAGARSFPGETALRLAWGRSSHSAPSTVTGAGGSLDAMAPSSDRPHWLGLQQQASWYQSYTFATHIFGIKYSLLTSSSKVPGKLSNSRVMAVGKLEEFKKKLSGFELEIC